jgi:hypothetical protein
MTEINTQIDSTKKDYSPQEIEFTRKLATILVEQVRDDIKTGKLDLNKYSRKNLA